MQKLKCALFILLPLLGIAACSEGPKGMVKIATDPGDAKIFIDDSRKGSSPSKEGQTFAIKLTEGEHVISAVKETGGPQEYFAKKTIFVSPDSLQTVSLKLEKRASQAFIEQAKNTDPTPKMVNIPAGSFSMGSNSGSSDEKPVHRVNIAAFELSKYEITFAQWDACIALGGCTHMPDDEGWGRGNRPVINVSFNDITKEFIPWLNKTTGKHYRLPTEAEWEYAARAGSSTKYSWGDNKGNNKANCGGCGSQWDNKETAPVGSFSANRFGLHDMHGNVWEVTQDCWNGSYKGAPTNGSAWKSGKCEDRVWRGGSWYDKLGDMRSAYRDNRSLTYRYYGYGFRLVQGR
jgi:formylglycine-generating enzyme required for sulfatase activity